MGSVWQFERIGMRCQKENTSTQAHKNKTPHDTGSRWALIVQVIIARDLCASFSLRWAPLPPPLTARGSNRCMSHLTIERLRQSDDTSARVDDEMVRELYAIFHRRSFGIVALQDEHFRSNLGRFWERQARGISSSFQDGRLVHVVARWNSKKETFVLERESLLLAVLSITRTPEILFSRVP